MGKNGREIRAIVFGSVDGIGASLVRLGLVVDWADGGWEEFKLIISAAWHGPGWLRRPACRLESVEEARLFVETEDSTVELSRVTSGHPPSPLQQVLSTPPRKYRILVSPLILGNRLCNHDKTRRPRRLERISSGPESAAPATIKIRYGPPAGDGFRFHLACP